MIVKWAQEDVKTLDNLLNSNNIHYKTSIKQNILTIKQHTPGIRLG